MSRALFIGRFQPFHNGHMYAVKHILESHDELVIVVAAAQYNYTMDNPFTAGERIEMIKLALEELYSKCYIIPVDNIPNNFEWPRHVLSYTPRVNIVYSNNEFVKLLFKNYGIEVENTPVLPGVSGTIIRKAMAEGVNWKHMVPRRVVEFIESIKGEERVKAIWKMHAKEGERY
ncbi:MAG: nicotinamide-nucleotide adenylyltransferase [Desulfurococcaceae archaeon]